MRELSITPSITVTIGRHTRLYFAFVTTAPAALDSPSTVTLHAAAFSDVAGFAADPTKARRIACALSCFRRSPSTRKNASTRRSRGVR